MSVSNLVDERMSCPCFKFFGNVNWIKGGVDECFLFLDMKAQVS